MAAKVGIEPTTKALTVLGSTTELLRNKVVPRIGLEPTRLYSRNILSVVRLPISPPRLILSKIDTKLIPLRVI